MQYATGETPFSLAYGIEAVVPIETEIPTFQVETFNEENNNEAMRLELDLIDEKRSEALNRLAAQKRKVKKYYNSKIKRRTFAVRSLVLRRLFQNTQVQGAAVLGPNWEGPYRVRKVIHNRTYYIEHKAGSPIRHQCNVEHLRQYYQ